LIYQNSERYQELDSSVDASLVTLINNHIDQRTAQPYTNLGAIYRDALTFVPPDTEVIIFWDDDDLFLENHIEIGIKGLTKGGKTAYKPADSYFRTDTTIGRVNNSLEPSIFVKAEHLYEYGFSHTTSDQHLQWLCPLVESDAIFVDPQGEPTLIYNWGDSTPTYKTSGNSYKPDNFAKYRRLSKQHGDGVISPVDIGRFYVDILSVIDNISEPLI